MARQGDRNGGDCDIDGSRRRALSPLEEELTTKQPSFEAVLEKTQSKLRQLDNAWTTSVLQAEGPARLRRLEGELHGHDHHFGRHGDLLQGLGKPSAIVFSRGWPLSSDDWDAQMLFFLQQGYRVDRA